VELPLKAAMACAQAENAPSADTSLALSYIASMSHDLRTPLNAILGFADLLTMSKRDAWSHAQLRSLDIVRERAVDLTALIDDMIDWAKLEAGELELQREVTGVLPIVERALAAATERSGGRGLSLSLHLDTPDAGKVWVDASRCVQALLGLLENAIRANPGREVQVRLQRTAANVRIEIEDPGLEIRAEDHTGVFDAFRPSYAPTGQRIAGLQLGPSVARSLLRAHGGDVWFESRPGRGTTFTATLPVAAGAGLPGNSDRGCGRL
jgi:signal transduction histidine kinase